MAKKEEEDVVIKRNKMKPTTETNPPVDAKEQKKVKPKEPISDDKKAIYAKALSILLGLFAFLMLLSLLSYTQKDELNAKVTLTEMLDLFSSDSMIRIKADTTYNWLGLLGAVMSNVLINWTIGYLIILLPIFIGVWAFNAFKYREIPDGLIRSTSIYLILSTVVASFIGALRNMTWFADIPKEWSGAVGIFLSTIVGKLIGSFGAFLIFLTLIILVLVFGTNIEWKPLMARVWNYLKISYAYANKAFKFLFVKVKDFEEANREMLKTVENVGEKEEEKVVAQEIKEEPANINNQSAPAIKITPTEPSKIVRSAFKANTNPIDLPSNFRSDKEISEQVKKLNISISKTEEKEEFVPLGLVGTDDDYVVSSRAKDFTSIAEEDEIIHEITKQSSSSLSISIEKQSENNVVDFEQEDDDVFVSRRENESQNDNEDDLPIIDEALLVSPISAKPILAPKPIEVAIPKKPLVINVEEFEEEDAKQIRNTLGVAIHDEDIKFLPPGLDLLEQSGSEMVINDEELKMNARILQEKLETFKIYIEDLTVTPGPVVTQYEFIPAAGIKISRIENLSDDLAMALKAKGIRIIAPIPGKGTVGIEIPNLKPSMVRFAHLVKSAKFQNSDAKLPVALGKTISGEVLMTDLAKAPHLLIAGSTGAGKSVGINTIINSLLYKMKPSELKFVIVDPKKVELQQYSRLRHHFIAMSPDIEDTIITNPQDAVSILKSVVLEMENRYNILAKVGQRNIGDYNSKVNAGAYNHIKDFDHRKMPYIVVVIDELADLMLTASKEVEEPIIRLAQMARAVGIHLVIATQRPSVDVITGIIKANFPARIAYLVASKIDSRTILDISGAEQLLGNGDMLFLPNGTPKPIRVQNSFLSTDEVDNICNFIGKQDGYSMPYMLPTINETTEAGGQYSASDRDPLFEEAAKIVIMQQQASVSLVQRKLKVGYARAGRIIDELEDAGIVGPNEGSKSRLVLLDSESQLERIL